MQYKIALFSILITGTLTMSAVAQQWYAGTWDSTIYERYDRPKTVGIRIEVKDSATGYFIQDVVLELKGDYLEELVGDIQEPGYTPRQRQFSMKTKTDSDGIVVFSLGWKKEYPWRVQKDLDGTVHYYNVHESWQKPIDDIEKVETIETFHPKYKKKTISFDFKRLLEAGSANKDESVFKDAWCNEIKRDDVKFCVMKFGTEFNDYENKWCKRVEFFKAIKDKDYGAVYSELPNTLPYRAYPQTESGPYFIYLIEIELERAVPQLEIIK